MKDVKRRKFINYLTIVGVGSLVFPTYKFMKFQTDNTKKVVVKISDLKFEINEVGDFFIINKNGVFTAFSRACTHLGCTLNFDPLSQKFICPCHKSEFLTDGKVIKSPATKNLINANVSVKNDTLVVSL